ncbi:hypothetical protein IP76_14560 [Rhizobium sp. AAP43]|nr:hypothetical protein IP76_14560 [Rhizobium sp. AAP43]
MGVSMFFMRTARIVAYLVFAVGILNVIGGFGYASGIIEQAPLPNGDTPPPIRTGPMIDKGMYMAAAALALGTLAEIGMTLRRMVSLGASSDRRLS